MEVVTGGGATGTGETYGDGKYLELAQPLATSLIGRPVSERDDAAAMRKAEPGRRTPTIPRW